MGQEFPAPLVDRLPLSLVNNRVFTAAAFFHHLPSGGVYLEDEPRKHSFAEYERFVSRPLAAGDDDQETWSRRLFRRQRKRLRRALVSGESISFLGEGCFRVN